VHAEVHLFWKCNRQFLLAAWPFSYPDLVCAALFSVWHGARSLFLSLKWSQCNIDVKSNSINEKLEVTKPKCPSELHKTPCVSNTSWALESGPSSTRGVAMSLCWAQHLLYTQHTSGTWGWTINVVMSPARCTTCLHMMGQWRVLRDQIMKLLTAITRYSLG
jgi:hypothetical protein